MKTSVVVCALVVAAAALVAAAEAVESPGFDAWARRFGKVYANEAEREMRRGVYSAHVERIERHNGDGSSTYKMGVNQFSDMTFEEWVEMVAAPMPDVEVPAQPSARRGLRDSVQALPAAVNWTREGVFGPVRDDGVCGCAWAFTVTETVSALVAISKVESPKVLSPQQLVDCTMGTPWGLKGCHGGWPQIAYTYVTNEGLCAAKDYPYHASAGTCLSNCTKVVPPNAVSYAPLPPSEAAFMKQLTQQPVMTAIGLTEELMHYSSGVFTAPCNVTFQHCVTIAGYGTTSDSQDYWLIRNNFGETWGDQGYLLLGRGMQYDGIIHGQCDVLGLGLYPTLLD